MNDSITVGTSNNIIRVMAIDRVRGFAIFYMIWFQFIGRFTSLPILPRLGIHAPNIEGVYLLPNLTCADIIAPLFLLAIGFTYGISFRGFADKYGLKKTVEKFIRRYSSLVGIGIILDGINTIIDGRTAFVNIIISVLTIFFLLFELCYLICRLFKLHKATYIVSKILKTMLICIGILGIILVFTNSVLLCMGKINYSFGYWRTLHHIGLAGLLVLPIVVFDYVKKSNKAKIISSIILFGLYTIFHESDLNSDVFTSNRDLIDVIADGGFIGGFGWAIQLLIFMIFADIYFKNKRAFKRTVVFSLLPIATLVCLVLIALPDNTISWAGAISDFLPICKESVSPSYVLFSCYISLLIFCVFDTTSGNCRKFDPFVWWGKNSILMYIIEFCLFGGIGILLSNHFSNISPIISFIEAMISLVILILIGYWLNKTGKVFKIT